MKYIAILGQHLLKKSHKNDKWVGPKKHVAPANLVLHSFPLTDLLRAHTGGGAIEMELSKYLRDLSRSIAGKEQLLISAVARALEVIPRQLCDNAGFDSTNILNKLRQKHAQGTIFPSSNSAFLFLAL